MDGNQSCWHDPFWYLSYSFKNSVNSFHHITMLYSELNIKQPNSVLVIKKCSCFSSSKPKFYWNQMCFEFSLERSWSELFIVKDHSFNPGVPFWSSWPSLLDHIIFWNGVLRPYFKKSLHRETAFCSLSNQDRFLQKRTWKSEGGSFLTRCSRIKTWYINLATHFFQSPPPIFFLWCRKKRR